MTPVSEGDCSFRRGSSSLFHFNGEDGKRIIDENKLACYAWTLVIGCAFSFVFLRMHQSTRTGLIGLAVLVCVVVVVILLNLELFTPATGDPCVTLDGDETCHSADPTPYRRYGTKTMYHVVLEDRKDTDLQLEGCTPKVFYLLSRHAARYPEKKHIVKMMQTLPMLKQKIINSSLSGKVGLCANDLNKLRNWRSTLNPEDDNRVSETGKLEAESLGQRLRKKFPSILGQEYSPEKFIFEYTKKIRTRTTAAAFAKGLFGEQYKNVDLENKVNDDLTFHSTCKAFQKECDHTLIDISEVENFEQGPLVQEVVKSISKRVGFNISLDEMYVIYKACMFGYALNTSDVWCSLLSTDELKVLEYGGDIDDYYKDAYGNSLNYKQPCPVARHIINLFKDNANTNGTKAIFHFSHSGAMKKVYSMFGLFKDATALMADDYCTQMDRRWLSSTIAPFNTNIAFVLYKCGNDFKVATLHNEKSVKIDGCGDNLCPLPKFYETYQPLADSCNMRKLCCSCCFQ